MIMTGCSAEGTLPHFRSGSSQKAGQFLGVGQGKGVGGNNRAVSERGRDHQVKSIDARSSALLISENNKKKTAQLLEVRRSYWAGPAKGLDCQESRQELISLVWEGHWMRDRSKRSIAKGEESNVSNREGEQGS